MSGLTKQFNKVNQYMSEKIWNVEGTKHDEDFTNKSKLTNSLSEFVHELQERTLEMVQPNPALRARQAARNLTSKVAGKARSNRYPQAEQDYADMLLKYAAELENHPHKLGNALRDISETYAHLAEVKDNLDSGVQQTFLEPLMQLENREIKTTIAHLKKLESRRLDYDCKKRQKEKGKVNEMEMEAAEQKFEESKELCEQGMTNLINNNATVEQLAYFKSLVDLQVEYHSKSLEALKKLQSSLQIQINNARNSAGAGEVRAAPRRTAPGGGGGSNAESPMDSTDAGGFSNGKLAMLPPDSSPFHSAPNRNTGSGGGGFSLQPPISNNSLSTSTPNDLNLFGSRDTAQDPWDITPVANNDDMWGPSHPAPVVSNPGSVNSTPSHNSMYPSLNHMSSAPAAGSNQAFRASVGPPPPVAPKPANLPPPVLPKRPQCIAKFDFAAESSEELDFKEGDTILLSSQVDDNWLEGSLNGRTGRFPVSYVHITVPL